MTLKSRHAIDCEDLLLFIHACMTSTSQHEFHDDAFEHQLTLHFLHEYICHHHRDLYALLLAGEINHHNRALILQKLLAKGTPTDPELKRIEGALILKALLKLPPNRAYKALAGLSQQRTTNRRARAIVRDFFAAQHDLIFHALKYKSLFQQIATHFHVRFENQEIHDFLFKKYTEIPSFNTPLLDTWRKAHYAKSAVWELPMTVAEGFMARHDIPRAEFLEKIAPQMTRAERQRAQQSALRQGAKLQNLNWANMPLTQVALTMLALPIKERMKDNERDLWMQRLTLAARRTIKKISLTLPPHVALVLDRSWSTKSSLHKKNRPLAQALALQMLCQHHTTTCHHFWTSHTQDPIALHPKGSTNLGRPLLQALATKPDLIMILSDGYENDPPGGVHAIMQAWQKLPQAKNTQVIHINPVFSATLFEPKALSPLIPTLGIRDIEDLPFMLPFAPFMTPQEHAPKTLSSAQLFAQLRSLLLSRAQEALAS